MSGFKTHLYGGTAVSAAAAIFFAAKFPSIFSSAQLFGIFLTGTIGSLIPDLDSNTSRPFSMLFTLLSIAAPILFFKEIAELWLQLIPLIEPVFTNLSKFQPFKVDILHFEFSPFPEKLKPFPLLSNVTPEFIITYFILSYILIKYGLSTIVKKITVHRGIIHSIPFALLCSEAGFFLFIPYSINMAIAVGISIFLGFIAHLLLDEINAITFKKGFIPKFKKSAGTAMKFKSNSIVSNIVVYTLITIGGIKIIGLIKL